MYLECSRENFNLGHQDSQGAQDGMYHSHKFCHHPGPTRGMCRHTQNRKNLLSQGFLKQLASSGPEASCTIIFPSDDSSGENKVFTASQQLRAVDEQCPEERCQLQLPPRSSPSLQLH